MIAHLRGRLIAKHPNQAIVEAAGVGYDVNITVPTFSDLPGLGSEVALHVHTHVREEVIALYGFLRADEKQLFEKLITVSGIGPKLAITILSGMATADMVGAIRSNDFARLTRIPGIGKKDRRTHVRRTARQAGRLRRAATRGVAFRRGRRCDLGTEQPWLPACAGGKGSRTRSSVCRAGKLRRDLPGGAGQPVKVIVQSRRDKAPTYDD